MNSIDAHEMTICIQHHHLIAALFDMRAYCQSHVINSFHMIALMFLAFVFGPVIFLPLLSFTKAFSLTHCISILFIYYVLPSAYNPILKQHSVL